MRKRSLLVFLALVLILALVAGCSQPAPAPTPDPSDEPGDEPEDDPTPDPGDVTYENMLTVGITEPSGNFNPAYYSSAYDGYVVDLVFQTLIKRNFDGDWEGEAAHDWDISEDGTTYTFYMREDNVFSDGQPVTAHDVVFSYMLISDPSYTGRYGSVARQLEGYDEFADGETTDFPGVVALDDYTVQFTFKEALRLNIANTTFQIMPKHYYGEGYEIGFTEPVLEKNAAPMGSGPYVLAQYQPAEFVYLTRNPSYVFEDLYAIEELLLEVTEMTTEMNDLLSGKVDVLAGQIDPDNIRDAEAAPEFKLNSYPRSGYGYVQTNHEFGPTTEKAVRQALYYGFNLDEFVTNYFQGYAETQFHPYSQVSWVMDEEFEASLPDYSFNLDKAKELLDDAGWVVGDSGFRERDGEVLELFILAMPDHDILDTLIPMWERDWGNGLNIKLNVAYEEFNSILDTILYDSDGNVEDWSMFFLATTITSYDPHGTVENNFHSRHIGSGRDNFARYSNPEVDALIDQGEVIMDEEEAKPIYQEIGRILTEDAVFMPVYANTYFDFYHEKLTNFHTHGIYNWVDAMRDARIVGH